MANYLEVSGSLYNTSAPVSVVSGGDTFGVAHAPLLWHSCRNLALELSEVLARLLGAPIDMRGHLAVDERGAQLGAQEAARRVPGDTVIEAFDEIAYHRRVGIQLPQARW